MTPRDVLDKLIDQANLSRMIGGAHYRLLDIARDRGTDPPPQCKPGYLLTKLNNDEMEILKDLTSDMTRNERHWSR